MIGRGVADRIDTLVLDLLEWIGPAGRPYADVLDAWRTSCPGLPVWEDARERGFVASHHEDDTGRVVTVTASGREFLTRHRRS